MAGFLKNNSGKFWTLNGKYLTIKSSVAISSGGSFNMSNGDVLYLEPTTIGGDIAFSTKSGASTVAFLENIDADSLYETGNGIFYDFPYYESSILELRVYSIEYYEVLNSISLGNNFWDMEDAINWYTGGPVITLRLKSGYWTQE